MTLSTRNSNPRRNGFTHNRRGPHRKVRSDAGVGNPISSKLGLPNGYRPHVERWWDHPDRPCGPIDGKIQEEWTDIAKVPKWRQREMMTACAKCPVYFDCLNELLAMPYADHYGIRAGIKGKV